MFSPSRWCFGWLALGVGCAPSVTAPSPTAPSVTVDLVEPSASEPRVEPGATDEALGGAWASGYHEGPHEPPTAPPGPLPGPCSRTDEHWDRAITRMSYDAEGRLIERLDADGGTVELVHRGRQTTTTLTRGGRAWQHIERYDEAGRPLERRELNADGKVVGREVWERDEQGRVVRRAVAESSDRLKYYFDFRYDERGREVQRDYGFFSEPGPFRRWRTTYAADGLTATRVRTRIEDGAVHSTVELTYDERGLLVKRRTLRRDGEQDRLTTWTYDEAGRVVASDDDWQGQRVVTRWRYVDGSLVEHTRDDGADGSFEHRTTFDYGCW